MADTRLAARALVTTRRDERVKHLYAVLRLDFFEDGAVVIPRDRSSWSSTLGGTPLPARLAATHVYESLAEAEAEAARLNELRQDGSSGYFVLLVRPSPSLERLLRRLASTGDDS